MNVTIRAEDGGGITHSLSLAANLTGGSIDVLFTDAFCYSADVISDSV